MASTRVVPFERQSTDTLVPTVRTFLDDTTATVPGVYSVDKLLTLQRYTKTTSPWRVAFVMTTVPICGLAGALLPSFVPLHDPLTGIHDNYVAYISFAMVVCTVMFIGAMMHWRKGAGIPSTVYLPFQGVLVALVTAALQAASFLRTL